MTSANPSKDEPTSMKRKLSPVEDDKPAKRPAKISSRLAYLLEYYKTHPNAHSPFRVQILERVAREKDEELEKEKTMAESAKIKQNAEIKAAAESDKQATPKDQAPGSEHDAEVSKTQETLVDESGTENIKKEVDHASAPGGQIDKHENEVKQGAGESSESRA